MEARKQELPTEVGVQYEALIHPTKVKFPKLKREIDLRTVTLEQAAEIAQAYPEILRKKEKVDKLAKKPE